LDSVDAELVGQHVGPGDKFTSGAAGRLVCASASGGVLCGGVDLLRSSKFGISRWGGGGACDPRLVIVDYNDAKTIATLEFSLRPPARPPRAPPAPPASPLLSTRQQRTARRDARKATRTNTATPSKPPRPPPFPYNASAYRAEARPPPKAPPRLAYSEWWSLGRLVPSPPVPPWLPVPPWSELYAGGYRAIEAEHRRPPAPSPPPPSPPSPSRVWLSRHHPPPPPRPMPPLSPPPLAPRRLDWIDTHVSAAPTIGTRTRSRTTLATH
jgi:hypothetical protein